MTESKILAVASQFDRPEAYILEALNARGFPVTVMADEQATWSQYLIKRNIEFIPLTIKSRFDRASVRKIREVLLRDGHHIVHCFSNRALTSALRATKGLNRRIVAYRGTVGHLSRLDPLSWTTYLHPRVDKIICVSNAVKQYLRKRVAEEKLVTIYKGHDTTWYSSARPRSLLDFGIPEGAFVVVCVANVRPVKGISYLIRAVASLPEDLRIHLLMVGKADPEIFASQVKGVRGLSRIHLAGHQADVASLLKACHVFVMPSISREGLPKALIEAMACGLPPIVTSVGGMPEVVRDGVNGIVVPPRKVVELAGAIEHIRLDPSAAHRFAEQAFQTVNSNFSIETSIEQTARLYQSLRL